MVKYLWTLGIAALLGVGSPALALESAAGPGPEDDAQEERRRAIDRWLVSPPLPAVESRRTAERLADHPPLFPDRDLEVGNVRWALERLDSGRAPAVTFDPAGSGEHRLLHAYLRADRDRTVLLAWRASACGTAELWLNGQSLTPRAARGTARGTRERAARDAPQDAAAGETERRAVRLAAGWNTLLVRAVSPGCPGEFSAWLAHARGVEPDAQPPDDIRVQASRPPGIHRTHPAPWVTVAERVVPGPVTWREGADDLDATLVVELASWGRDPAIPLPEPDPEDTAAVEADPAPPRPGRRVYRRPPPEDPAEAEEQEREPDEEEREPDAPEAEPLPPAEAVEESWRPLRARLAPPPPAAAPAAGTVQLEGRAGRTRIRTTVRTARPGAPVSVEVPVSLRELRRAAEAPGGVSLDVRWSRERWRGTRSVDPEAVAASLREPIPLTGWFAAEEPARGVPVAPGPPGDAGEPRSGRWRVPAELAGGALELRVDGAPGRYRVDGGEATQAGSAAEDGSASELRGARIPLCDPCREGATILIQVESTGEWTRPPRAVRVEGR